MELTTVYERGSGESAETLTVMAYIGVEEDDGDEIRVIRAVAGSVVDDGIAYFGRTGQQWLSDRHANWIAEGYEMTASTSGLRSS